MKKYLHSHRVLFGLVGFVVAIGIATAYLFILPEEASKVDGIVGFILRYTHSICWAVLALASGAWALSLPKKIVTFFVYIALGMYIIFITSLVTLSQISG